jgi:hypothetical protein
MHDNDLKDEPIMTDEDFENGDFYLERALPYGYHLEFRKYMKWCEENGLINKELTEEQKQYIKDNFIVKD